MLWGIVAIAGMLFALLPLFGAFNWLVIPFAGVGIIFSAIAVSVSKNRDSAKTGLWCNAIACGLGFIRLIIGGGIL